MKGRRKDRHSLQALEVIKACFTAPQLFLWGKLTSRWRAYSGGFTIWKNTLSPLTLFHQVIWPYRTLGALLFSNRGSTRVMGHRWIHPLLAKRNHGLKITNGRGLMQRVVQQSWHKGLPKTNISCIVMQLELKMTCEHSNWFESSSKSYFHPFELL